MRHLLAKKNYLRKMGITAVAVVLAVAFTPLPHTVSAAGSVAGELQMNESLNRGESIISENGQYKLTMQNDGNLVQYNADNKAVWALGIIDSTTSKFAVQADGNMVLYNQAGKPIWQSSYTYAGGIKKLAIQNDGNIVQYVNLNEMDPSNTEYDFTPWTKYDASNVAVREALLRGQTLTSKTGKYRLRVQQDGNMVIRSENGKPVWQAKPYNSTATALYVDEFGEARLTVIVGSGPNWSSKTKGAQIINRITLQDDGNLVLYNDNGQVVWHR